MKTVVKNGARLAVCDSSQRLDTVRDFLDLLVSASYPERCDGLVIYKESLPESFFDLKTGLAGEALQKFSNYRMKLAVVGDFSGYTSKSLRDFIYECNKGKLVFFKDTLDDAITALGAK
jgi:hypothetical protein